MPMSLDTRYKAIYFRELKKVSDELRDQILKSVNNDSYKNREVKEWIENIALLAEAEYEKECETEALILKNKNKPKDSAAPVRK